MCGKEREGLYNGGANEAVCFHWISGEHNGCCRCISSSHTLCVLRSNIFFFFFMPYLAVICACTLYIYSADLNKRLTVKIKLWCITHPAPFVRRTWMMPPDMRIVVKRCAISLPSDLTYDFLPAWQMIKQAKMQYIYIEGSIWLISRKRVRLESEILWLANTH